MPTAVEGSPATRLSTAWIARLIGEASTRNETASFCIPLLHGDDFPEEEIRQALFSAYQGHSNEHSTRPATLGTEKELTAPDTISGEELRIRAPFLPENIVSDIPSLLSDAIRFYTDRRERDMALLAACTVLSACLPGVWGIYNRKRVYPTFYRRGSPCCQW